MATGSIEATIEMAEGFRAEALAELSVLGQGAWRDSLEDLIDGVLAQIPELPGD